MTGTVRIPGQTWSSTGETEPDAPDLVRWDRLPGMTTTPHLPPLAVLTALAAPTYGWFRSSDAAAAGVSPRVLTRLRRREAIETPHRNVNRLRCVPDVWEGRAIGALWTTGGRSALARWTAVRILLETTSSPRIDVVVPRGVEPERPTVPFRTSLRLRPEDVVERGPFRVTSPAFTVCDLAAVTGSQALTRLTDRLVAASLLDAEALHEMVTWFAWIEGVERARAVLAELVPALRWTRSDGERAWGRIVVIGGLPTPVANLRVTDADGARRYLDFAWPDRMVAVELDLHPNHATTIGRRADGARQNALVLQGWTILRFDLADLMQRPDLVLRTVAAALALPR